MSRNAVYLGDRRLEPPEDVVMINCTHCRKSSYSAEWVNNRGGCPRCQKPYAGPKNED